jgi:hypothetical protein
MFALVCCCHEDGNVPWKSHERPALLHRHVVNDVASAEHVAVFTMAQYPNVNFVRSDTIQEFGLESGGSDEAPSFQSNFIYTRH